MKSMLTLVLFLALVLALGPRLIQAESENIDEDALFADSSLMVDTAARFHAQEKTEPEAKTIALSGNILAYGQVLANRAYLPDWNEAQTSFGSGTVGNLMLDVRMQRRFRAFADLEWFLDANRLGDSALDLNIPETFLDANINHKIWFRFGKQVLQWGRGWFFNPTDLINVEHKSFLRKIGSREGVFGAKVQVPFSTKVNLSGFLDAHGVSRPDSLAGAIKAEFLVGRTEFALSAWQGGARAPVYGADFSSRLFQLDLTGEIALYQNFQAHHLLLQNGIPVLVDEKKAWQPRMAIGLSHSFEVSGIPDRLLTMGEYYYNHPGSDEEKMPFADLLRLASLAGFTQSQAFATAAKSGVYEANNYSQHYAAFFATFSRFIRSDLSLSANAIGNLNQSSAVVSLALSYRDLNDFGLTLSLNSFVGPEGTEYTLTEQAVQLQLLAEAAF